MEVIGVKKKIGLILAGLMMLMMFCALGEEAALRYSGENVWKGFDEIGL